jgi:hypothetical protein
MIVRQGNRSPASPDHLHHVLATPRLRPAIALQEMQRSALVEQLCHVTTLRPAARGAGALHQVDPHCNQLRDMR